MGMSLNDFDNELRHDGALDEREGAYTVNGWSKGIAWYYYGPVMVRDEDWEWSGIETVHPTKVLVVMVGDDKKYEVEWEDVTPLDEDAYCHECGQIGCQANA